MTVDTCQATFQIPSYYTGSSGSGGTSTVLTTKNIDLSSLVTNTLTCTTLTIDGEPIEGTDILDMLDKTVFQTTGTNLTSFYGTTSCDTIQATTLNTDLIQNNGTSPIAVSTYLNAQGTLTSSNSININNTLTNLSGNPLLTAYTSTLTSGTSMAINVGNNDTQCAQLAYKGDNTLKLNLNGSTGFEMTTSQINLPQDLYLRGQKFYTRSVNGLSTLTTGTFTINQTIPSGRRKVVAYINWKKDTAPTADPTQNTIPYLLIGGANGAYFYSSSADTYFGTTNGNSGATCLNWGVEGIPLFNSTSLPAYLTAGVFTFQTVIEFTYMGLYTGSQEIWAVSGSFGSDKVYTAGTGPYFGIIQGSVRLSNASWPILGALQVNSTTPFTSGYFTVAYF